MHKSLRQLYWSVTTQFGFQPLRALRAIRALPLFLSDLRKFKEHYRGVVEIMPFLHDRQDPGGDMHSEYFLQDLYVARRIFAANPIRHIDVASRVDGFVAHVASFRTIEILDIRPIDGSVPGIIFTQADLMNDETSPTGLCDSLSCLHAIEHFGLGRYGDKVDPLGWKSGFHNLSRILKSGGRLYLSAPIGKPKVVFNAHRIFDPVQLTIAGSEFGLQLERFLWISEGKLNISLNADSDIDKLSRSDYSIGIFEFIKT